MYLEIRYAQKCSCFIYYCFSNFILYLLDRESICNALERIGLTLGEIIVLICNTFGLFNSEYALDFVSDW